MFKLIIHGKIYIAGSKYTAGFLVNRENYGSVCTRTRGGYVFLAGSGTVWENRTPRYTRGKPYPHVKSAAKHKPRKHPPHHFHEIMHAYSLDFAVIETICPSPTPLHVGHAQ